MSVEALQWVFEEDPEPSRGPARAVLIVQAWSARPDGTEARQAHSTIAQRAGLSPRAVRDALGALEDAGTIKRTGYSANGGTVIYRLVFDAEERRAIKEVRRLAKLIEQDGDAA